MSSAPAPGQVDTVASGPPIALTMGDPAGIGPETIVKALHRHPQWAARCLVVGDQGVMRRALRATGIKMPVAVLNAHAVAPGGAGTDASGEGRRTRPGQQATEPPLTSERLPGPCLPLLPVVQLAEAPAWGVIDAAAGRAAADAVIWAAQAALDGRVAAVVTAPLNKAALSAAGLPYPGHTELLQALAARHRGVPTGELPVRMMLSSPQLRTVLVSIHLPLREAIAQVSAERVLQTLRITAAALSVPGVPLRIAVAGLNPHAGEGGLFGDEEVLHIAPAIAQALAEGLSVSGPHPPDTVFMRAARGEFDVVVAMYHDQGLIPVKYLGVEHGVNTTLGLPFVRTSPDHGTAFDIAGSGQADSSSLEAAIRAALAAVDARAGQGTLRP